jgi:hypothetical protein
MGMKGGASMGKKKDVKETKTEPEPEQTNGKDVPPPEPKSRDIIYCHKMAREEHNTQFQRWLEFTLRCAKGARIIDEPQQKKDDEGHDLFITQYFIDAKTGMVIMRTEFEEEKQNEIVVMLILY